MNRCWFGGGGLVQHWGQSFARSDGQDSWKLAQGIYRRTYFNHRADLLPGSTRIAPDSDVLWAEFTDTFTPFDLRGQRSLIFRYENSFDRRDDAWAYLPQLRRARRLSTSEKSDSVMGSEMTYEDFLLFSGYIWDQEWRAGEERPMLAALDSQRVCFPKNVAGWRERAVAVPGTREHFDACRFGPDGAHSNKYPQSGPPIPVRESALHLQGGSRIWTSWNSGRLGSWWGGWLSSSPWSTWPPR